MNRLTLLFVLIAVTLGTIAFVVLTKPSGVPASPTIPPSPPPAATTSGDIEYTNGQYGFTFTLPSSWRGYSAIAGEWEGYSLAGSSTGTITERGPIISLRHPQWTAQIPRQNIPIMVFTTSQWNSMQQDEFHIGAAPINPSEIGRTSRYVFALPARYNYAFPSGWEEVEAILQNKPLRTF